MTLYLTNPKRRRRVKRRTIKQRNRPSTKQLAARRKFAAMARARATASRRTTRRTKRAHSSQGGTMAKRRRRRARPRVARRRRRVSVARINPPRRRRRAGRAVARRGRRRYRSNPGFGGGIVRQLTDTGMGALGVLVGGAAGRTLGGMIPIGNGNPYIEAAKAGVVAVVIRRFAPRLVGQKMAEAASYGALAGALKTLIVGIAPQAGAFLGDSNVMPFYRPIMAARLPTSPHLRGVGSYASYAGDDVGEDGMGSYADSGASTYS